MSPPVDEPAAPPANSSAPCSSPGAPNLSGLPNTGVNPSFAAFAFLTKLAKFGLVAVPALLYKLSRLLDNSGPLPPSLLLTRPISSIPSPRSVLGLRPNAPCSGMGEAAGERAGDPRRGELPPGAAPSLLSSRVVSVLVVLDERTESNSEAVMRERRRADLSDGVEWFDWEGGRRDRRESERESIASRGSWAERVFKAVSWLK